MSRLDNRMRTVLDEEFLESITNFRIIQVQDKFPNDKLDLTLSLEEYDKKHFNRPVQRSPSLRHRKVNNAVQELERSNSESNEHECESKEHHGGRNSPNTSPAYVKRAHVQEGSVKLSSHNSTNDRYFILFNDLLLVAKHKSPHNLKLKERVRVSELWLSQCIEEVTDQILPNDNKSFVIGWPTLPALCNYVASFNSIEEKEIWQTALEKTITERKNEEAGKDITVKVCNRINEDVGPQQSTLFNVNQADDVRTVIKMALEQFQYQNEDPNEYQLWMSSKDTVLYPLIGHESPYAIKSNHTRNMCCHTTDENNNQAPPPVDINLTWQFVLKKNKRGCRSPSDLNKHKATSWKNQIRKPLGSHWGSNKMNKQKSVKGLVYNQNEILPPGKLFGNPLAQLSTEEETIPKPIKDILIALFRKGPGITGIFRKSALARTAKQLRQALDTGKEVEIAEKSTIVLATVLKEFFRSLPESLICSEIFDELCNTKDLADHTSRIDEIKRLMERLPKENYQLLMYFMCLLHHIQRFSDQNNMNSYNLSVCVSQSIMKATKDSTRTQFEQTSGSNDAVTFIIENYLDIFSRENEYLLGQECDIQFDDGPGDDSDSGTDQYRDRDLSLDDGDDSEKEIEPPAPEILFTPNIDSPFGHSDSSIGTNDSDELRQSLNRGNLHVDLTRSKSTPSSPLSLRREDEMDSGVSNENLRNPCSDMSDYDDHNEFHRTLFRQPRHKRGFSNKSTAAELIEHKRHIPDIVDNVKKPVYNEVTNKRTGGCYDHIITCESDILPTINDPVTTCASSTNEDKNDCALLLKKEIITAQPLVQHFATESHTALEDVAPAKPSVIFHTVDKKKQPAAPSYEEHIQKTHPKPVRATTVQAQKIIQPERAMQPIRTVQPVHVAQAVRKPKLSKNTKVQRHSVEDYIPPQPGVQSQTTNSTSSSREKISKLKPHVPHNISNFMHNRKNKFQSRKENSTAHKNSTETSHQRIQRCNNRNDTSPNKDKNGTSHHGRAHQSSAEQLQNENIENQKRNTMLATQMRNDMLTTHNRNNLGDKRDDYSSNNTIYENGNAEQNEKSDSSVCSTSETSEASTGKKENTCEDKDMASKTKQPRISVTVLGKGSDEPKSNVYEQNHNTSVNSTRDSTPIANVVDLNSITLTNGGQPSKNGPISREGRKTFRSSTKLRISPHMSPARGASKQRSPTNEEPTPVREKELCPTQEILVEADPIERPDTLVLPPSTPNHTVLVTQDSNSAMEIPQTEDNSKKSPLDSPSPFSLTPKSTIIKTDCSNSPEICVKFQLENALLTKATKNDLLPITQLAKPNQTRDDNIKPVGAKELRRTSRKLKSQFRTFGDGMIVNTPREERRVFDMKKNRGISMGTKFNSPYNTPKDTLRRGCNIHNDNNDLSNDKAPSQTNAHLLHEYSNNPVARKGRSNSHDHEHKGQIAAHRVRSSSSEGSAAHEAYARMMSQEESYV